MPDIIPCPWCHRDVSRRTIWCRFCGAEISGVPEAVTFELLDSLCDEDVPNFLFRYVCPILQAHGCSQINGHRATDVLATLPRGFRANYALILLDSEVRNGGFYQWFTNSSGQLTAETLDDLGLIGAAQHVALIGEAIRLNEQLEAKYPGYKRRWEIPEPDVEPEFWTDVKTNFHPAFDRLSDDFYNLEEADSLWNHFLRYVREHPDQCLHSQK